MTLIHDGAELFGDGSAPLQKIELHEPILLCVPIYSHDDLTPEFTRRNRPVDVLKLSYKPKDWSAELLEAKKAELEEKLSVSASWPA